MLFLYYTLRFNFIVKFVFARNRGFCVAVARCFVLGFMRWQHPKKVPAEFSITSYLVNRRFLFRRYHKPCGSRISRGVRFYGTLCRQEPKNGSLSLFGVIFLDGDTARLINMSARNISPYTGQGIDVGAFADYRARV